MRKNIKKAVAKEIKLDYRPVKADQGIAPYFREQVRKELVKWADDYKKANGESVDIYGDGLKIHIV